jgi:prevent-host-death family protein
MATAIAPTKTTEVSIAEAKAKLSELVRRVEMNGETITITRRGKAVAILAPAPENPRKNWITDLRGLFADCPEACDEIDKVYAERHKHKPRYVEF